MTQINLETMEGLIDLHLHLDGSISIESAKELARMQGMVIPKSDEEIEALMKVSDNCKDLNEYLTKFDFSCSLLQTREAIATAVYNLEKELKESGVIYAEIRFAPQKHCQMGLTQEEVVEAAIEGNNRCDLPSNLILCCMREEKNQKENMETVRVAAKYREKGVCAVDLAGAEALYKVEDYEDVFAYAKACGLHITIHAGEAAGPESISNALRIGAERIGHGIRCMEDRQLVKKLANEKICLECCPTSNLNTNIYENLAEYPLMDLLKEGVMVTVNTDNMSVSNTTLRKEYEKLVKNCHFSRESIYTVLCNAIQSSFAGDHVKRQLYEQVETLWK